MAARDNRTAVLTALESNEDLETPRLFVTTDAGHHWTERSMAALAPLYENIRPWGVAFDGRGVLHVAGELLVPEPGLVTPEVPLFGAVFHTESFDLGGHWSELRLYDKSTNWFPVTMGFSGPLGAVFWPEDFGMQAIVSSDAGRTWSDPTAVPGCTTPSRVLARNGGLDLVYSGASGGSLVRVNATGDIDRQPTGLPFVGNNPYEVPDLVAGPNGTLAALLDGAGFGLYESTDGLHWEDRTPSAPEGWAAGPNDYRTEAALGFDKAGRLHVIDRDDRDDHQMPPVVEGTVRFQETDRFHGILLPNGTRSTELEIVSQPATEWEPRSGADPSTASNTAAAAWVGDRLLVAVAIGLPSSGMVLYSLDVAA